MIMFIGSKEVKSFVEEGENVHLLFEDDSAATMAKSLYDLIVSESTREGGVVDAVRHYFATEFLARMAEVGLEYYMVEHVAEGIKILIHNLREKAIAGKFGVESVMEIKISEIIPE